MEKRIRKSLTLLSVGAALLCSILIFFIMNHAATQTAKTSVMDSARTMADIFNSTLITKEELSVRHTQTHRLTWIDADGEIIYDTAGAIENHADRPEVQEALEYGYGAATRMSSTLQEATHYYAQLLDDGTVLRMSVTEDSGISNITFVFSFVILALAFVTIFATFVASKVTKNILEPIDKIDIEHPMQNDVYEELSPFLRKIHSQNKLLSERIKEVTYMHEELGRIMQTMAEGLIVFDEVGLVLSINRSAIEIFDVKKENVMGQSLLALRRSKEFLALSTALEKGENMQTQIKIGDKIYVASLSQVSNGGGSIMMIVDKTSEIESETMRREFSANVSHELKTPLQSILGFAELLKYNMVKEEDKEGFYNNIYRECNRLIVLIQDIIDLSRLDEGVEAIPREEVDLLQVVNKVKQDLSDKASKTNVDISVIGKETVIKAVPALIYEAVFNLVDNAINYNVKNGSVRIVIKENSEDILLSVEDTGIGIPTEHKQRVFERFFRVDKSHSRSTGGTGLGLSIVKHVAKVHNANIELNSKEGEGTVIKISFGK